MEYVIRKILLVIAMLLNCQDALQAKSLNLILVDSPEVKLGEIVPVKVGNQLIFERIIGNDNTVWSYGLESGELTPLGVDSPSAIIPFKGQAIIVSNLGEINRQIQVFVGANAPLIQLGIGPIGYFRSDEAFYVIKERGWASDISRYDGNQIENHELSGKVRYLPESDFNVCELGDDFLIMVSSFSMQGGVGPGYMINSLGQAYYPSFTIHPHSRMAKLEPVNDKCVISSTSIEGGTWNVDNDFVLSDIYSKGEGMKAVSLDDVLATMTNFQFHKGYVFASSHGVNPKIYKLDPNSLEVLKQHSVAYDLPYSAYNAPQLVAVGDYIYSGFIETEVFDLALNKIAQPRPIPNFYVDSFVKPEVWSNMAVVANQNQANQWRAFYPNLFTIINDDLSFSQYKDNRDYDLINVGLDAYQEHIMITAVDVNKGSLGYYALEDKPQINSAINGAWFDPEMANQGLALNKGIRHDGSEYVFVTAYLFENGKPLWLAGTAEVTASTDELTVALFRFNGLNMLEPSDQQAEHEFVGNMTLSLSDCNTIDVEWVDSQQTHELTMFRADNVMYKNWCQD
ncbi:hypothetical protein [Marinicella rhabdoformis]|uniref:hypothetical protein n=1 Tax=Marinicella rhabdoformis TaxID=2580566 RepID=UPI0012AECE85|nr:hypothetical protein [Marinicella rhabdoformis]